MRRRSARAARYLRILALATVMSLACSTTSTGPKSMASESPDPPYVRGRIADSRLVEGGGLRLRVEGRVRGPDEAIVSVAPGVSVRWADGSAASVGALAVGQAIAVWTTGPELRSLPPQVSANAIVLERPKTLGISGLFGGA